MKLVLQAATLLTAVFSLQSMALAQDVRSNKPANRCEERAVELSLAAVDLADHAPALSSIWATGSAVIVSVSSATLQSATNPAGQADVTVYISNFDGSDCKTGSIVVAIYDTNG